MRARRPKYRSASAPSEARLLLRRSLLARRALSARAGGATDLFIARVVPYYVIQRMGRWASDHAAALVYYDRHHEEDPVLRAVFTAFRYVANPTTSGGTPIYSEGGVVV